MSSLNGHARVDLARIRESLASTSGARYWRSLEELAQTEEFGAFLADEFPAIARLWERPVSRRTTLKLMAASMALAGLTACGRQPTEHIVPYTYMPEHVVPGRPRFYATSALIGGYAHGVLAESHEGRPTKLEGNPDHPATLGALDARAQASVLSLYDPDRSSGIRERGDPSGIGSLLTELGERRRAWNADGGAGLAILTGTVTSPSETAAIGHLLERWPQARWYTHEPVDRDGVHAGTRLLHGRPLEPVYHFDRAAVVLSLDADFLQSQPGFLRHARDFAARRRPRDREGDLARLYAVESTPSITGAYADHCRRLAHPRIEACARQLARAFNLGVTAPLENAARPAWMTSLAADLRQHGAQAVLVPGDQQPAAVHAIAHAINHALGCVGRTVEFIEPVSGNIASSAEEADAGSLATLTRRMHGGEVDSLIVLESNPVYTAPADLAFAEAYRQVPWRLHWGLYQDETAELSHWHVPAAHALESWADARAHDGTAGLIQPLIEPLQGGRTALQMLSAIETSAEANARELLRQHWRQRRGGLDDFEAFWRRALHDGVVPDSAATPVRTRPRADWLADLPAPAAAPSELLLQFRPDPALWDGADANNGWLQELPQPLTKITWDNAALVSPALAEARGLDTGDEIELAVDDRRVRFPVYVLPGQPRDAVTVHLGHGRERAGRIGNGVGRNAYALRSSERPWSAPVSLTATGDQHELATTQSHHSIEGRHMIRAADLATYREQPDFAHHVGEHVPAPEESLYPEPWPAEREPRHAWSMVIDLSACIGCNACVTACQAENNIPVVGADEVRRGREMHWIRIDRYFEGALDGPNMVFQPVTCMHCENAPCEYVCPVEATQHSADGLNEMIYNRCIGTRYCSQNCPYKVRVFNWFDYTSEQAKFPAPRPLNNPDVTVRAQGVMEKCTYCVQRIRSVQQRAGVEDRAVADGELQTACQQACPTQAIVFGDRMNPASQVSRLSEHPLNYAMLAELNTRPRTTYLAAVRNPNPALDEEEG
ncbi:MAG: TAT-variant-translocated molybdopterin oxidoreductase [Halofilum sp. (in: g-proteobacteria)]